MREGILKDILKGLAVGAGIFLILSHPAGPRRFVKIIRHGLRARRLRKEYLMQKFYYLRRKNLISFREKGNMIEIVLTEEGERKVLAYDFEALTIVRPKRWDHQWRLIFYDIPENKKKARDALNIKLRELGLLKFNDSVWVYPYECKKEVDFVSEVFEVGKYVHYAIVSSVTNEANLRLKFNL